MNYHDGLGHHRMLFIYKVPLRLYPTRSKKLLPWIPNLSPFPLVLKKSLIPSPLLLNLIRAKHQVRLSNLRTTTSTRSSQPHLHPPSHSLRWVLEFKA
ncbi:hypothetical protein M378DRAFT_654017 [Amanita muscaria Koide BX008]|uniref:Uncharacterized protein n=1 Tax=Amanita muscaria (strain Koide BX008) TaxID=946122 RepID=A0A0C2SKE6_AMAMK|nr:hypothetical protein M378DRAFT_654017 [Amanita muscaria Koide BX008]